MSLIQSRPSMLASQQAMEKTQVILNQDNVTEVEFVEIEDVDKNMTKKKTKTSGKPKSTSIVPIIKQKSKEYDLNYFKQLTRRMEHMIRIHDPTKNKNDHGSKDHGLVYLEFNAGLFQAMKSSMVKTRLISIVSKPIRMIRIDIHGVPEIFSLRF